MRPISSRFPPPFPLHTSAPFARLAPMAVAVALMLGGTHGWAQSADPAPRDVDRQVWQDRDEAAGDSSGEALATPAGTLKGSSAAADSLPLKTSKGMVTFDYQSVKAKGFESVDLLGFHFLRQFNDWLYFGVGGHAPLFQGSYGGMMVFDATVHAERKLFGPVTGSVGLSLGGGGGGNTVLQSKTLTGTGGFVKGYARLGYDFNGWTVGLSYSRLRFTNSAINSGQWGVYMTAPFTYSVGSYAQSGTRVTYQPQSSWRLDREDSDKNFVTLGLENIVQIQPKGNYTGLIHYLDGQFSHFVSDRHYVFANGGVGYRGLELYNQVFAGVGQQFEPTSHVKLRAQIGVGSGGYAPEKIDTGPGLLVHPKVSAEYRLSHNLGVSLTGGYLFAPRGSSKNFTVGAALNYYLSPRAGRSSVDKSLSEVEFRGHRINIFSQSTFGMHIGPRSQSHLHMLSMQYDNELNEHWFVPVHASVAYTGLLNYPGFGELLTGIGWQTAHSSKKSFQPFAQLLVGANGYGLVAKPGVGFHYGIQDDLALYAIAGRTQSLERLGVYPELRRMSHSFVGFGLSYRFSLMN